VESSGREGMREEGGGRRYVVRGISCCLDEIVQRVGGLCELDWVVRCWNES
jgi:hypothetical protein